MISSNISEILLKNQINTSVDRTINDSSFINSLIDTKTDEGKVRTTDFTYENIKGISLEEIEEVFTSEEDKSKATNLRLATLFTEDSHLGQALFDTVLGKPFSLGYSYLYDTYEDKNSFLSSFSNTNNSLADLLHSTVSRKISNSTEGNASDKIPQEYLDEILLEVNSFNFVSALSSTSKDQYGRYKDDDDDDYAFLYNDYNLKYQELMYKYEDSKNYEKNLLSQYK